MPESLCAFANAEPPSERWRGGRVRPKVETAGIEPASAVAQEMASTSVAGALISLPPRRRGWREPAPWVVLGSEGANPHRASPLVDPGYPRRGRAGAEMSLRSLD